MNVNPNQETALENYFDALLFADESESFEETEKVSSSFSDNEISKDFSSQIEIKENNQAVYVEPKPPVSENVLNAPVDQQDGCNVITKSMTEDDFLFIRPVGVVGLNLALPMDRVTEVIPYDEAGVNILGGRGNILGNMTFRESEVVVLDTAKIIVPHNHSRRSAMLERKNYQYVLILDGGSLAIAVDSVDEEVYLSTENIRWNPVTSHYVWLAGTMTDYGYALVNADKLSGYLM